MVQSTKTSWLSALAVALLAVSTVHAHPVRQMNEQMEGQAGKLDTRSPRLIPNTAEYLNDLFEDLGLKLPSSSTATPTSTPVATPTASFKPEQDEPENIQATPTTHIIYSSSTSYTPTYGSEEAGYTHTVKQETSHRPLKNIQLGHGWNEPNKPTADDADAIFDSVYTQLKHELSDVINSSDEVGLDRFIE
ncbi:uncharacterized protein N7515_005139 [Penicillium bovifimosum]|uniref:Uncharacterized protein n=1 Tax=Penicillium bovifimosum TaxID=126998 RepID=A0A9W9H2V4_9EURO|nr:uncharacterized protein N7515_005139 [Penicillium bovifimosum]KAJ5135861.1 hypothetical protein N7515_005139 [Penicillium bovifimosum]